MYGAGTEAMVKVYGKRSRSWMYDGSQTGDELVVELSDDGEIYEVDVQRAAVTEPNSIISSCQDGSYEDNQDSFKLNSSAGSFSDGKCNVTSTSVTSNDNIMSLKAFDFLEEHSSMKRRKKHYKKACMENLEDFQADLSHSGSVNPINKTVDDLNHFLASLQSTNVDKSIEEHFEEELQKAIEEGDTSSGNRVMYDRSRTILFNKDNDGIDLTETDQQTEIASKIPKACRNVKGHSTHHYNELKNIGEALKYQDELEFLTEEPPTELSIEIFLSRLLSLALAIEQDGEFLEYIHKHSANEVCRWCFGKQFLSHPVVILLQLFLLTKIRLPAESLPPHFDQFIANSLSYNEPPAMSKLTNKLTRLNLGDFLEKTGSKSAQNYSLQLCLRYPEELLSKEVVKQVLDIVDFEYLDPKIGRHLYPLVEHILTSDLFILTDISQVNGLLGSLINALPNHCCNESLVKSLIILSNVSKVLVTAAAAAAEKLGSFMRYLLDFILERIHPVQDSAADLLILYLGLLLNVLSACELRPFENAQIDLARKLLISLSTSDADPFIVRMYSLNLTHILFGAEVDVHQEEKELLFRILKSFDREGENSNQVIRHQIKAALHNLL